MPKIEVKNITTRRAKITVDSYTEWNQYIELPIKK